MTTGLLALGLLACVPRAAPPSMAAGPTATDALSERCGTAVAAMADSPAAERMETYLRGCAEVYRRPACRAAFEGWASIPVERRAWALASACRDAYCPTFTAPRPELCDVPEPDIATLWRLWPPLHGRILADELGLEGEERARLLAAAVEGTPPPPVVLHVPAVERRRPAVAVLVSGGVMRVRVDGVEHAVPDGPGTLSERLGPLLAGREGELVGIEATADTDFRTVAAVLEALNTLGVTRVEFASTP